MIHPNAVVPVRKIYKKSCAILTEEKAPDSTVEIKGLPNNALVIKIDDAFKNDQFFSGIKGECKRADYVIVADTGKKKRILYIELKKKSDELQQVVKQLKGAQCVINYCRDIAETFYDHKEFLAEFESRFISFGHTGTGNSRKTRETRTGSGAVHDEPDNVLKIDWPANIQFNRLAG